MAGIQKWAPPSSPPPPPPPARCLQVLLLLRSTLGPSMSLYLNPPRDLTEMPLKSFYRYALPVFTEGVDTLPGQPTAHLTRMPRKRVLTLNMDVPEPWLVEATYAPYDLDNLRLADIPQTTVYAEFELESLLLTGSCIDISNSARRATATRGLQLHLGTPAAPHGVDTLVMSNLAYFQLKAAPGSWLLSLAPGRSREVYAISSSTGTSDGDEDAADAPIDEARTQVKRGFQGCKLYYAFLKLHVLNTLFNSNRTI